MSAADHMAGSTVRRRMNRLQGLAMLVCTPLALFAQGDKDLRTKADALFARGEYAQAFEPYQTLVSNNVEDFDLNFRYGVCALYAGADKDEAIKFIKRSTLAPTPPVLSWYFLGKAYHLTYHFKEAIAAYDRFQGTADKKTLAEHPVVALLLQCRNGQNLLSNLKEIDVHNKVEVAAEDFFRFYDLASIGGKIVVTPEELLTSIDKKDPERGLVYLPDKGGAIYFSSHGKNNDTGRDIYRTELMPDGSFAQPVKLAGYINTDQDENYPFMAPDGRSFYFCSKGHNSMGGYDVFKSTYDKGMDVFGAPVNMDFAVNTPDDDVLYLTDPEGKEACFASARDSKQGMMHVYRVSTTQAPVNITVLKGTFASQFDPNDRKAHVVVVDALTQENVADVRTDRDGSYVLSLPRSGRYKFMVEAGPGGRTHVGMVEVPRNDEPRVYRQEMSLVDQGGEKLMIKNYFDQPLEEDMIALALEEIKRRAKLDVGTHAAVAEASVPQDEPGDALTRAGFAGDVSKPDALRMAAEDAEMLDKRAEEIGVQAKAAYSIALENLAKADGAAQKAESFVAQANAATDEGARNKLMTDAARQRQIARATGQRARAAFQAGQELDAERTATALQAQKAQRLSTDLTQVLGGSDENAAVVKLVELKKRMDEKNAPDAGLSPAEKMRRAATDSEHEAATALQRANEGRAEETELADRVARKRREEGDAKGRRKEDLARERGELEQQLTALHDENEKAFAKARVAQRTSTVARGQADLARKLTAVAAGMTVNEIPADQVAQIGQRIGGVGARMDDLALDERFDAAISDEVRESERTMFDWGAAEPAAGQEATASTITAPRDASGDAQHQQGATITMDQAALGNKELRQGSDVPPDLSNNGRERSAADTTHGAVPSDRIAEVGNARTDVPSARTDQRGDATTTTTPPASNVPPGNSNAGRRSDGPPDGAIGQQPGTAGQDGANSGAAPSKTSNDDTASAKGIVPVADDRSTANPSGQGTSSTGSGAKEEGRIAPGTEVDPSDRAFVLSNELAELNQLRSVEKNKHRRDSLDNRIAEVQGELRVNAAQEGTSVTGNGVNDRTATTQEGVVHEETARGALSEQPAKPLDDQRSMKPAFVFTPATSEDEVLKAVFPDYLANVARIRQDITDPQDRATGVHGLELMLADSLDAESARQTTELAQHPERSAEYLPRIDRLRRIKEDHITQAERALQEAQREYAASETRELENTAIAARGASERPDGTSVRASVTPHNDEYIDVEQDPEFVYTSSVVYRAEGSRKESAQLDQHLNDLSDLEDRIDSLEDVLDAMPEGKAKDKLRDRTDRLIDDRMIARTEIGQATAFYTRAEFKAIQDSAKRLETSTASRGLPLTEPSLQLAANMESHAAVAMADAARTRKRADRTEDIVERDSLLRAAYAQELDAIREMDRALTVRNYILSDHYDRGGQLDYASIERRMFGEANEVAAAKEDAVPQQDGLRNGMDSTAAPILADAGKAQVPPSMYKEFMGTDTSASPLDRSRETDISSFVTNADQAAARAKELERASVSAADRANALQDSVALVRRGERARMEKEAARMRALSDSLHREAVAAGVLERDMAAHDEAQAKESAFRKRLMQFYYLDDEQQALVLNDVDRSRYFEARSLALQQREQAAQAAEQAASTKRLADAVLQQSADVLAKQAAGDTLFLEGSARAQQLADQAILLTHRSDSLNAVADRLSKAAGMNEAQSAALLQGLDPQRGTEIMAMEQKARRVEPSLAQARSNEAITPIRSTEPVTPIAADTTVAAQRTAPTGNSVPPAAQRPVTTEPPASGTAQPAVSETSAPAPVIPALLAPLTSDVFTVAVDPAEKQATIPMDAPMPAGVVFKVQVGAFKHEIPAEVFSDMSPVAGENVAGGLKRYTVGMFTNAQSAAKATAQVRERGFRDAFVVAYQDGKRVSLAQAMRGAQPESGAAVAAVPRPARGEEGIFVPHNAFALTPVIPVRADTAVAADQDVLARYPASAEQLLAQFAPPADATAYYNDPKAAPARQVETVKGLFFTVQVGVYSRPTALDRLFNITPLNSERTETNKIRYTTGVFVDMDKARARKDETVGLGVKDAFITAYLNGKRVPMRDARALIARFGPSVFVDQTILTR